MPMKSLQLPKKTKKEKEADCAPCSLDDNKFPHGTRIELRDEIADRFAELMKLPTETKLTGTFQAELVEVSTTKRAAPQKNHRRIEIQIESMDIKADSDREFNAGMKEEQARKRK